MRTLVLTLNDINYIAQFVFLAAVVFYLSATIRNAQTCSEA